MGIASYIYYTNRMTKNENDMKTLKFNFRKLRTPRLVLSSLLILFLSVSVSCQIINNKQKTTEMTLKYGESIELNMNETVKFKDGLSIFLRSFSHKSPYSGGPTKATAYIRLSKGELSEEVRLSVHGGAGKTEKEYDTLIWNEYEIQLKAFSYDQSIEIIVTKMK